MTTPPLVQTPMSSPTAPTLGRDLYEMYLGLSAPKDAAAVLRERLSEGRAVVAALLTRARGILALPAAQREAQRLADVDAGTVGLRQAARAAAVWAACERRDGRDAAADVIAQAGRECGVLASQIKDAAELVAAARQGSRDLVSCGSVRLTLNAAEQRLAEVA